MPVAARQGQPETRAVAASARAVRRCRWLLVSAWTLIFSLAAAAAATDGSIVERLTVTQPRSFGYALGDIVERDVTLVLRLPYELDLSALAAAGPANFWLTRRPPEVTREAGRGVTSYDIRFRYQVTNFDPGTNDIPVSHENLSYTDGEESAQMLIPATRIRVHGLLAAEAETIQPDLAPRALPFAPTRALAWALLACVSLVGLALLRWDLFSAGARAPFRRAVQTLRPLWIMRWE